MIRKSNFELLRIVAILMIIGLHYLNGSMGGALSHVIKGEFNYYIANLIESFCIIGVNLFVLTTGYFNINKKSIDFRKLFLLIGVAYCYGLLFYALNLRFSYDSFNLKQLILAINPFLSGGYWFIKYYVILNLLAPFINVLMDNLTKVLKLYLISILLILFSIWPSFLPYAPVTNGGYGLMHFILMYILGAYIRTYGIFNYGKYTYFLIYVCCGFITFLFSIAGWGTRWSYDFIFNIIGSTALFIVFSKIDIQSSKINYLSKFTFNVYLIHFSSFMINFLYHGILKCQNYYNSPWFIFHLLVSVVIIYLVSIGIDIISKFFINLFKRLGVNLIKNDRIENLERKMDKLLVFNLNLK